MGRSLLPVGQEMGTKMVNSVVGEKKQVILVGGMGTALWSKEVLKDGVLMANRVGQIEIQSYKLVSTVSPQRSWVLGSLGSPLGLLVLINMLTSGILENTKYFQGLCPELCSLTYKYVQMSFGLVRI